jgi:hypothetical protein
MRNVHVRASFYTFTPHWSPIGKQHQGPPPPRILTNKGLYQAPREKPTVQIQLSTSQLRPTNRRQSPPVSKFPHEEKDIVLKLDSVPTCEPVQGKRMGMPTGTRTPALTLVDRYDGRADGAGRVELLQ